MTKISSKRDGIAQRYSTALFSLAQDSKALATVAKDVARLHQALAQESSEWSQIVNPTLSLSSQRKILERFEKSLKLGKILTQFLKVVWQNYRLQNLVCMLEDFMRRYETSIGSLDGALETATKLSQKSIDDLQESLKQQLGKEINLHQEIKENLLGGVTLRIGSLFIDASTQTRLNKLRQVMKG